MWSGGGDRKCWTFLDTTSLRFTYQWFQPSCKQLLKLTTMYKSSLNIATSKGDSRQT